MRKRCQILLWLIGLLAAGCQHGPYTRTYLELLNAEKRALEDELYELEFDYEDACREIDKLKQQNARLGGSSDVPNRSNSGELRRGSASPSTRDSKSNLTPPMVDEGTLAEPRIELPSGPLNRELPLPNSNTAPGTAPPVPPVIPPRSPMKSGDHKSPAKSEVPTRILSLEPADPRVTHIVLNQLLTGGSDFDRQPGDDGIVVVLEPRNRDDAFVALAGPITVVLLDPAKTAEQGRIVARWEIDANQAQQSLRNSPTVRGIELRLPWPATPPQTGRLHLHVRYMTVDNRDLRTDRQLFIHLPGQFTQQWTPRAATRSSVTSQPSAAVPQPGDVSQGSRKGVEAQNTEQLPEELGGTKEPPPTADASSTPAQATRPEWRPQR